MRKLIVASIAVAGVAVVSIPTSADARKQPPYRQVPRGPGLGLPPGGWRGLGWDGYYVYNPAYYGYGCYRPVLFWTPPPLGLAWQHARVC
jgi:hypothetical protein